MKAANSVGEMMIQVQNQMEVEARQQSYAAATTIVTSVVTRYGNHEAVPLVVYWTAVADGIYKKIKDDQDAMIARSLKNRGSTQD